MNILATISALGYLGFACTAIMGAVVGGWRLGAWWQNR